MLNLPLFTCVCLLFATSTALAQTVRVVDDDGQGTAASCDDSAAAFTTVGAAISAAAPGETVLVCPGTYVETIQFAGKAIRVVSVAGPNSTVLDGGALGSVVSFVSNEGPGAILEGFTVRNGRAQFQGGGIRIEGASPVVRGNRIVENRACSGAGMVVSFGSPLIEGNTIAFNLQSGCSGGTSGGGIYIGGRAAAVVRGNTITDNYGGAWGGGISLFAAGSPLIEHNVILRNTSSDEGGGMWLVNDSDATIRGNLIAGNVSAEGGGIHWSVPGGAHGPRVVNNTIVNNSAATGSGVFAGGFDATAELVNNVIIASPGRTAVWCDALYDPTPPVVRHNHVYSPDGEAYGGSCGNLTGTNGNIGGPPAFVDAAAGNYRLAAGSASIDAGTASAVLPSVDLDGVQRVLDGNGDGISLVDAGAYEAAAAHQRLLRLVGNLDFGQVPVGSTATRTLRLENTGNATLTVSGIAFPAGFSGSWAGTIAPATATSVEVTFAPTDVTSYGGQVVVSADQTGGSNTIAAGGRGICSYQISPAQQGAAAFVSNGRITVSTQPGCAWAASTLNPWLTITSDRSVTGSGHATFSIAPNPERTARTGYIFAAGGRIATIVQAGTHTTFVWWQHEVSGDLALWLMDGRQRVAAMEVARVPDTLWKVFASADMTGDGHQDLIWQHEGTGRLAVWQMNGTLVQTGEALGPGIVADRDWKLRAAADLDRDGHADLLWQHVRSGEVAAWLMRGSALAGGMVIATVDTGWRIVDAEDLNADGSARIVWQHADGRLAAWSMSGTRAISGALLTPERATPLEWQARALADLDGDMASDLVWQQTSTGHLAAWFMSGNVMQRGDLLNPPQVADTRWRIVAAGR